MLFSCRFLTVFGRSMGKGAEANQVIRYRHDTGKIGSSRMPDFPADFLAGLRSAGALTWLLFGLPAALFLVCIRRERVKRAAAEDELRESKNRYRAIFETAVDA